MLPRRSNRVPLRLLAGVFLAATASAQSRTGGVAAQSGERKTEPGAGFVAGRVRDLGGEPRAAELILRWRVHPELPGLCGASLGDAGLAERGFRTGADGRFRIALPHRGPFLLLATAGDRQSQQEFPVMAGDYRELRLLRIPAIGGVVFGPDGNPMVGARVVMVPDRQTWSRLAAYRVPERRGESVTDGEGRFELPWEFGYLRRRMWGAFVVPWVQSKGLSMATQPLLLRPTEGARSLHIALEAERRISGRIVDVHDEPIPGLDLVHDSGFLPPVRPDSGGEFSAQHPEFGRWLVMVRGYAPRTIRTQPEGTVVLSPGKRVKAVLVGPDGTPHGEARVLWSMSVAHGPPLEWTDATDAGGAVAFDRGSTALHLLGFVEVEGRFVRFFAGIPRRDTDLGRVVVSGARTLRGQVLSSERTPLSGARVALLPRRHSKDHPARVTYTDRGGRFAFHALANGAQVVMTEAGGEGHHEVIVDGEAEQVALTIPEGVSVTGIVRDENGSAVAGAWVTIVRTRDRSANEIFGPTPGMLSLCTFTESDGSFRFRGLPVGEDWTVLCNYLRDGTWSGGGSDAPGAGAEGVVVSTRQLIR